MRQLPVGQLPFLQHNDEIFSSLHSMIKYVLSLPGVKSTFSQPSGAETAWITHAESALGDLVANMLWALEANWSELTHPTLAKTFPIPQRYYSPHRIRATYKARLEAADLWSLPGVEQEDAKKTNFRNLKPRKIEDPGPQHIFAKVFEREKVLEKARTILELFNRLLGNKAYFGGDSPTLLDITVAAHLLLLLVPPFPDPLLQGLINTSFPSLVIHADRMRKDALNMSNLRKSMRTSSFEDVWLQRLRFGFFGVALGGIAAYTIYSK
ncbi:hypothetical protein E1B28_008979 [Marasmius oreades]|uniref:GST C-terminal domain-containing protein n=1 Tax=Marasmius oreades TaxID=181124 RepID=A0A9P7S133_9AGAR|nr:uncharacterized protein E1B28_008979 [Marasmius oreades]KAG7092638.1 hypothetical protein E1B28_008979 [Marasmius oreades]